MIKNTTPQSGILDVLRVKVSLGTVKVDEILYKAPVRTRIKDGEFALARIMPDSFRLGGKKVLLIRGESWTEI